MIYKQNPETKMIQKFDVLFFLNTGQFIRKKSENILYINNNTSFSMKSSGIVEKTVLSNLSNICLKLLPKILLIHGFQLSHCIPSHGGIAILIVKDHIGKLHTYHIRVR
jgi:hypothetical protein